MKCPICETETRKDGRPFTKQGQLNLHVYHCKMKNGSKKEDLNEECEHDFRFLNLRQPIENKAYENGYKEVCVKCQELH